MRIQFASDLHLELRPKMTFRELLDPGVAPVLALLGDIAPLDSPQLRPFMEWCSERWDTVLWIPGVLELIGQNPSTASVPDLQTALAKMRALVEPFWNITVKCRFEMPVGLKEPCSLSKRVCFPWQLRCPLLSS